MPEYRVYWSIDIESGSPEQAAQQALAIQQDPESTATVFTMIDRKNGRGHTIDLANPARSKKKGE